MKRKCVLKNCWERGAMPGLSTLLVEDPTAPNRPQYVMLRFDTAVRRDGAKLATASTTATDSVGADEATARSPNTIPRAERPLWVDDEVQRTQQFYSTLMERGGSSPMWAGALRVLNVARQGSSHLNVVGEYAAFSTLLYFVSRSMDRIDVDTLGRLDRRRVLDHQQEGDTPHVAMLGVEASACVASVAARVSAWLGKLATSLQAMHDGGVAHGDVRLSSLFITSSGLVADGGEGADASVPHLRNYVSTTGSLLALERVATVKLGLPVPLLPSRWQGGTVPPAARRGRLAPSSDVNLASESASPDASSATADVTARTTGSSTTTAAGNAANVPLRDDVVELLLRLDSRSEGAPSRAYPPEANEAAPAAGGNADASGVPSQATDVYMFAAVIRSLVAVARLYVLHRLRRVALGLDRSVDPHKGTSVDANGLYLSPAEALAWCSPASVDSAIADLDSRLAHLLAQMESPSPSSRPPMRTVAKALAVAAVERLILPPEVPVKYLASPVEVHQTADGTSPSRLVGAVSSADNSPQRPMSSKLASNAMALEEAALTAAGGAAAPAGVTPLRAAGTITSHGLPPVGPSPRHVQQLQVGTDSTNSMMTDMQQIISDYSTATGATSPSPHRAGGLAGRRSFAEARQAKLQQRLAEQQATEATISLDQQQRDEKDRWFLDAEQQLEQLESMNRAGTAPKLRTNPAAAAGDRSYDSAAMSDDADALSAGPTPTAGAKGATGAASRRPTSAHDGSAANAPRGAGAAARHVDPAAVTKTPGTPDSALNMAELRVLPKHERRAAIERASGDLAQRREAFLAARAERQKSEREAADRAKLEHEANLRHIRESKRGTREAALRGFSPDIDAGMASPTGARRGSPAVSVFTPFSNNPDRERREKARLSGGGGMSQPYSADTSGTSLLHTSAVGYDAVADAVDAHAEQPLLVRGAAAAGAHPGLIGISTVTTAGGTLAPTGAATARVDATSFDAGAAATGADGASVPQWGPGVTGIAIHTGHGTNGSVAGGMPSMSPTRRTASMDAAIDVGSPAGGPMGPIPIAQDEHRFSREYGVKARGQSVSQSASMGDGGSPNGGADGLSVAPPAAVGASAAAADGRISVQSHSHQTPSSRSNQEVPSIGVAGAGGAVVPSSVHSSMAGHSQQVMYDALSQTLTEVLPPDACGALLQEIAVFARSPLHVRLHPRANGVFAQRVRRVIRGLDLCAVLDVDRPDVAVDAIVAMCSQLAALRSILSVPSVAASQIV